MVERTFGAIKAAGTRIREVSGGRTITPSGLGWTGVVGILERGNPGEPIIMLTKKDAEAKIGGLISDSLAPDAIFDFMRDANGAGGVVAIRVTDGNEVASEITLYARRIPLTAIGKLKAKNGGRWGGAEKRYTAVLADVVSVGESTLTTGLAMKVDEWKGAELALTGVPNTIYTVTGNDATGILSVESDETMSTDLAAGADPTNGRYYLTLTNGDKNLAVVIGDGDDSATDEWSLDVYLNGLRVIGWKNLHTDPEDANYWQSVINSDSANEYVTAVDEWQGSHTPSTRPANHYSTFSAITATTLTAVIHDFVISGSGNPTMALGTTTDEMVAQSISLTMTGAAAFTAVSDLFGALGSGTFGTEFAPANKWAPPFTITAGVDAMTIGDEIVISYKPFAARSLIGGRVFPNKDTDRTLSYRIVDNTHKVITVVAGSTMSTDVAPIAGVAASGSIQWATKANHVNGEFVTINGGDLYGAVTFWIDTTGAYVPVGGYNPTNLQLDISGATTAQEVAAIFKIAIDGLPADFKVSSGAAVLGLIPLTNDVTGVQGNVAMIENVAHASFIATGMTGGVDATVNEFMVEAALQMHGGRDGNSEIVDADYELQAWALDSSPFLKLRGMNLGLLKMSTPGITATAVQRAGIEFAYANNYSYFVEIPANITTETAADNYLTNTIGRSVKTAYAFTYFPSYGYVTDSLAPKKLKLVPLSGMILGYHAACARDNDGYHKAAAGVEALLPRLIKLTIDTPLNGEFLNPRGINILRKRQGNFVIWGDRTLQADDPEWTFAHQRWQMSHYENTLLENLDVFTFKINDSQTQSDAKVVLIAYFRPEFSKRALRGDKFEDACILKIDAENNTNATMALGDMHAEISLRLADTVERFIITIGKQGVNENVA